jgi:hypothetical protein
MLKHANTCYQHLTSSACFDISLAAANKFDNYEKELKRATSRDPCASYQAHAKGKRGVALSTYTCL